LNSFCRSTSIIERQLERVNFKRPLLLSHYADDWHLPLTSIPHFLDQVDIQNAFNADLTTFFLTGVFGPPKYRVLE
jgi:hypothetical protein